MLESEIAKPRGCALYVSFFDIKMEAKASVDKTSYDAA